MESKQLPETVLRSPLTDAQKFQILLKYSQGIPTGDIAKSVSRDTKEITHFVVSTLDDMTAIRETKLLMGKPCSAELKVRMGKPHRSS